MEKESPLVEDREPPGHGIVSALKNVAAHTGHPCIASRRTSSLVFNKSANFSTKSWQFCREFFPGTSKEEWNDWRWQVAHAITSFHELHRFLNLSSGEREIFLMNGDHFPLQITPYYLGLIDPDDCRDPLRRCVIPTIQEAARRPGESEDPLHEEHDSPVPGLVHRYPDRVLFLVTDFCSTYCRYCTRSRLVGKEHHGQSSRERWQMAIDYIERTPRIRDVLISGGDPLTLDDDRLSWLLARLRRIPHVEIIRIGTKVPVVLPQRITPSLVRLIRRHHPVWMSIHFTHPAEITKEAKEACTRLADAGIPLLSQTVLLKGVNDNTEVLRRLFHELVKLRVRPYYLYQCDPIVGSGHFRTSVTTGLDIIAGLRGYTSGFAVPLYVIDAPGGGGKIPIMPSYQQGYEGHDLVLKNHEGKTYRYHDEEPSPKRESATQTDSPRESPLR